MEIICFEYTEHMHLFVAKIYTGVNDGILSNTPIKNSMISLNTRDPHLFFFFFFLFVLPLAAAGQGSAVMSAVMYECWSMRGWPQQRRSPRGLVSHPASARRHDFLTRTPYLHWQLKLSWPPQTLPSDPSQASQITQPLAIRHAQFLTQYIA